MNILKKAYGIHDKEFTHFFEGRGYESWLIQALNYCFAGLATSGWVGVVLFRWMNIGVCLQ